MKVVAPGMKGQDVQEVIKDITAALGGCTAYCNENQITRLMKVEVLHSSAEINVKRIMVVMVTCFQ